jgi:hypothetical protein
MEQAMCNRRVDRVLRDSSGQITYLLGSWGAASSNDAIGEVESGDCRYFIQWGNGETVDVAVTNHDGTKALCTDPDDAAANRLDAVPTLGRAV